MEELNDAAELAPASSPVLIFGQFDDGESNSVASFDYNEESDIEVPDANWRVGTVTVDSCFVSGKVQKPILLPGTHLLTLSQTPPYLLYCRIPPTRKKTTHMGPNDFEQWIKLHDGDKDFADLINSKVAPRKRRSLLSNVSFAYSSDESSNSEDEEEDDDFGAPTTTIASSMDVVKGSKHSATSKKPFISQRAAAPVKKSNWFTGLFHKQPKALSLTSSSSANSPPKPPTHKTFEPVVPNKTVNISNFFTSKKKPTSKPKEQAKKIPNLPKRYPIPIERVIYEISWMKLNNPRRPLVHHVSISNMLVWYANMADNRQALLYLQIPARSTSSHVPAAAVIRPY